MEVSPRIAKAGGKKANIAGIKGTEQCLKQLTLTAKPDFYKYTHIEQYCILTKIIVRIFRGLQYNFHPELTKKGNIHFHGTVEGERYKVNASVIEWEREVGFTKKSLKSPKDWREYCGKNCVEMNEALRVNCSCIFFDAEPDSPAFVFLDSDEEEKGIVTI